MTAKSPSSKKRSFAPVHDFDIIVAGAGPAGLSVAADLSKDFRVLLVDKRKIPYTTAAWYSYEDRVKKNGLQHAVLNNCKDLYYKAEDQEHRMIDRCVILDTQKVLSHWLSIMKKNNGVVIQQPLVNAVSQKDIVVVTIGKKNYTAKLLIDCTGFQSPVLKKNHLIKRINTWIIYGYVIEAKMPTTKEILFLPVNDDVNTYWGIYPHHKNKGDAYVFYNAENEPGSMDFMIKTFNREIKKQFPKYKKLKELTGRIITGELNRYALDRIVFFGEAGMLTPPACGMGFNEILVRHEKFSKHIKRTMKKNMLDQISLEEISLGLRHTPSVEFQWVVAKFTYYYTKNPHKWRDGVKWLNALGKSSKYWMRNELTTSWIENGTLKLHDTIPISSIIKTMPPSAYSYVFTHFAKFIGESVDEEVEREEKRYKKELLKQKLLE